jgi:hypothetical protein
VSLEEARDRDMFQLRAKKLKLSQCSQISLKAAHQVSQKSLPPLSGISIMYTLKVHEMRRTIGRLLMARGTSPAKGSGKHGHRTENIQHTNILAGDMVI